MKNRMLKNIALSLFVIMMFTLFAACGNKQEEPAPEIQEPETVDILDTVVFTFNGKPTTYKVNEKMTTDGYINITSISDYYDSTEFSYNADGEFVKAVKTKNDNGTTEKEEWTYENGVAVSGTYRADTFYSDRDITVTSKKDDSGRIVKVTENIVLKDKDDGSVENRTDEYEINYDENGRVVQVDYYTKGALDHTTYITYDANGKMLSYSNVGSRLGEYLRLDFTYIPTDAAGVTVTETDPLTYFFNIEKITAWFV